MDNSLATHTGGQTYRYKHYLDYLQHCMFEKVIKYNLPVILPIKLFLTAPLVAWRAYIASNKDWPRSDCSSSLWEQSDYSVHSVYIQDKICKKFT